MSAKKVQRLRKRIMKTRDKFRDSEVGSKKEERLFNKDIKLTDKLRAKKNSKPKMAAKKYTPKDINKNGKLDQWEIKKYEIINRGKPQMGIGEHNALKPKFLKGIFTKDDGSMSTLGNVANTVGPLAGLVGIGKSITDLIRGGKPAMTDERLKKVRERKTKAYQKKREKGMTEIREKGQTRKSDRKFRKAEKKEEKFAKKYDKLNKPSKVKKKKIRDGSHDHGKQKKRILKPAKYVSDAQRKAVWASKKDGGKGNPNKKKK